MLVTIVLTAVITLLVVSVALLFLMLRSESERGNKAEKRAAVLSKKLNAYVRKDAYNSGLYDGRETDGLYRGMLRNFQKGKRTVVQLKGGKNE